MANYADLDEATLKDKLATAESYEERSLLRQALRQKKKERGEQPIKRATRGSTYNRFAATSRGTVSTPKNYVASGQPVKPKNEPPARHPVEQAKIPAHVEERPISLPREPTPPPREPTPPPREPTPPPREPTPPPREPTPPPREPTPPPREPTPPPREPTPPPREPTPPPRELTPEDEEDGYGDPDLGEEDAPVSVMKEPEEKHTETPNSCPKVRDRAIEEATDIGVPSRSRKAPQTKVDFGVKLKSTPPKTQTKPSTRPSPSGGGPRTLRDYQELAARSSKSTQRPVTPEDRHLGKDELQQYLVAYVNKELGLHPPMPAKGRALFETASDPTNLCKLINKSVRNTVDLRALTKIPLRGSVTAKREALEENMVLVVESARAIGCRVVDDSAEKILSGDPDTICQFLVDLIRARVVHMPEMEDESSSTFTNLPLLFSKLDIRLESVDGDDAPLPSSQEPVTPPAKEPLTYEERAALRRAEREKKKSSESSSTTDMQEELSYEERAARRRQERERRRREREALAS